MQTVDAPLRHIDIDNFREAIADCTGVPAFEIHPHSRFVADLGMDSLDTVELLMEVEDRWAIDIPDDVADTLFTVQDAMDHIKALLQPAEGQALPPSSALKTKPLSALTDLEANWAMAMLLGLKLTYSEMHEAYGVIDPDDSIALAPLLNYCGSWAHGGPLVEKYDVGFRPFRQEQGKVSRWVADVHAEGVGTFRGTALYPDQLGAAVRAILHAYHGERLQVPAVMREHRYGPSATF